jgi:hypothetical protein
MNREHVEEQLDLLSEYYSETLGTDVRTGIEGSDIWVSCSRTNGREYFEEVSELENRVKILYDEMLVDDDYSDPLEGWI